MEVDKLINEIDPERVFGSIWLEDISDNEILGPLSEAIDEFNDSNKMWSFLGFEDIIIDNEKWMRYSMMGRIWMSNEDYDISLLSQVPLLLYLEIDDNTYDDLPVPSFFTEMRKKHKEYCKIKREGVKSG